MEQVRGYFRYLTHKDNPEKYQYNEKDITIINDFDIDNYNYLSVSQIKAILIDIQKIIRDNTFTRDFSPEKHDQWKVYIVKYHRLWECKVLVIFMWSSIASNQNLEK